MAKEIQSQVQSLFKQNGFEEIGRRKNYYASLGEDALNMVLHIEG